jgi:hypothetical protein
VCPFWLAVFSLHVAGVAFLDVFIKIYSLGCIRLLLAAGIREARQTYMALIPVVGGIVMATLNEPSFHLLGFLACTSATAGRALKSVVQVGGWVGWVGRALHERQCSATLHM